MYRQAIRVTSVAGVQPRWVSQKNAMNSATVICVKPSAMTLAGTTQRFVLLIVPFVAASFRQDERAC
jgi:hypothetical protein